VPQPTQRRYSNRYSDSQPSRGLGRRSLQNASVYFAERRKSRIGLSPGVVSAARRTDAQCATADRRL
jgi:hypothetical protein